MDVHDDLQIVRRITAVGAADDRRQGRPSGRQNKDKGDTRTEAQRDCDRIYYSTAWRRLAGVTQVVTPFDDSLLIHNRLTHSEKVAQVARSIAERQLDDTTRHRLIAELGGIDVNVCEAAALAHDLGHPPFGHVGEETLDRIARRSSEHRGLGLHDGFEGNAQSIRIVSLGKIRNVKDEGLDLTHATLAAIAKYPWMRTAELKGDEHLRHLKEDSVYRRKWKKFNFYSEQADLLEMARGFTKGKIDAETQTLEASVMDAADDISYAVHDLEDFYLAGILNVPNVLDDLDDFKTHIDEPSGAIRDSAFFALAHRLKIDYGSYYDPDEMREAVRQVSSTLRDGFNGRPDRPDEAVLSEAAVRSKGSSLIGKYIKAIEISKDVLWEHGPHLGLASESWHEVQLLKVITRHYVIARPDIALLQRGQQTILESLVELLRAWVADESDRKRLPARLRAEYDLALQMEKQAVAVGYGRRENAPRGSANRSIIDYLCSLSDSQCTSLYQKLSGAQIHRIGNIGAF